VKYFTGPAAENQILQDRFDGAKRHRLIGVSSKAGVRGRTTTRKIRRSQCLLGTPVRSLME